MKKRLIFTHPLIVILTLPMGLFLWSTNAWQFNFQQITDFCALAFTLWSILVLLNLVIKIPKGIFFLGALYFIVLGTYTLITYRPFFSFPTVVHVVEAVIGYGFVVEFWRKK